MLRGHHVEVVGRRLAGGVLQVLEDPLDLAGLAVVAEHEPLEAPQLVATEGLPVGADLLADRKPEPRAARRRFSGLEGLDPEQRLLRPHLDVGADEHLADAAGERARVSDDSIFMLSITATTSPGGDLVARLAPGSRPPPPAPDSAPGRRRPARSGGRSPSTSTSRSAPWLEVTTRYAVRRPADSRRSCGVEALDVRLDRDRRRRSPDSGWARSRRRVIR